MTRLFIFNVTSLLNDTIETCCFSFRQKYYGEKISVCFCSFRSRYCCSRS